MFLKEQNKMNDTRQKATEKEEKEKQYMLNQLKLK